MPAGASADQPFEAGSGVDRRRGALALNPRFVPRCCCAAICASAAAISIWRAPNRSGDRDRAENAMTFLARGNLRNDQKAGGSARRFRPGDRAAPGPGAGPCRTRRAMSRRRSSIRRSANSTLRLPHPNVRAHFSGAARSIAAKATSIMRSRIFPAPSPRLPDRARILLRAGPAVRAKATTHAPSRFRQACVDAPTQGLPAARQSPSPCRRSLPA